MRTGMTKVSAVLAVVLGLAVAVTAAARLTAAPTNSSPPTISGTAQQGQTLTTTNGTWSGTEPITYIYAWQRCDNKGGHCADIKNATSATYVLAKEDVNHTLRVAVSAKNAEGTNTALSAVTGVVTAAPVAGAPVNTALPTISGTAQENQTLTTTTGAWSGAGPITFTYTWERCDTTGGHCGNIGGSNHPTYKLVKADVGKTIRVEVAAKNSAGTTKATSAATGVVGAAVTASLTLSVSTAQDLYGVPVTLSGKISTAQAGQTVTIAAQPYGTPKLDKLGTASTASDGSWSFKTKPSIQTAYQAQWNGANSATVTVGVKPLVTFHVITGGRFSTKVAAGRSFAGKLVQLQRRSRFGQWVTLKRVKLGSSSNAIFRAVVPKGTSTLRMAFSVNQAGAGYLGGTSRTIVYHRS
jgi:hypothetical protein